MAKKKPKNEVVLTVKCTSCGKKRDIKPGEIDKDDFPMCDVCYMPMMPHQAKAKVN
jgi:hypothetical protein